MYEINTLIVNDFNRRFGNTFNKRKVEWNEHIVPIFRYLNMRARTCKIADLDTYEYLTNESCTKLSKRFNELQEKIDSATEEVLKVIRKRRDDASRKVEESRLKLGPIEREKKEERFPPE
jgi:pyruvate/2-oxoacid:ferredoxin oxidoreductase beta subunit